MDWTNKIDGVDVIHASDVNSLAEAITDAEGAISEIEGAIPTKTSDLTNDSGFIAPDANGKTTLGDGAVEAGTAEANGEYSVAFGSEKSDKVPTSNGYASAAIGGGTEANGNYAIATGCLTWTGIKPDVLKNIIARYLNGGSSQTEIYGGQEVHGVDYRVMNLINKDYPKENLPFTPTGTGGTYLPSDIDLSIFVPGSEYIEFLIAYGNNALSGGYQSTAVGQSSVAYGQYDIAYGHSSMALGYKNYAWGGGAVAIGLKNEAGYWDSPEAGHLVFDNGYGSIAIGKENKIYGTHSIGIGTGLSIANGKENQTVLGKFNAAGSYLLAVGNGTSTSSRSNALEIGTNGNIDVKSHKITGVATPTSNTDAATKKYVDDSISDIPIPTITITYDRIITTQAEWDAMTGLPNWGGIRTVSIDCDIEADNTIYIPYTVEFVNFNGHQCNQGIEPLASNNKIELYNVRLIDGREVKNLHIISGCSAYQFINCTYVFDSSAFAITNCDNVYEENCSAEHYDGSTMVSIDDVPLPTIYAIDAKTERISNVAEPVLLSDAATKSYVDSHAGSKLYRHDLIIDKNDNSNKYSISISFVSKRSAPIRNYNNFKPDMVDAGFTASTTVMYTCSGNAYLSTGGSSDGVLIASKFTLSPFSNSEITVFGFNVDQSKETSPSTGGTTVTANTLTDTVTEI